MKFELTLYRLKPKENHDIHTIQHILEDEIWFNNAVVMMRARKTDKIKIKWRTQTLKELSKVSCVLPLQDATCSDTFDSLPISFLLRINTEQHFGL